MLTDPNEIRIIQRARQKNVRDPNRSRLHFENILRDFFDGVDFSAQTVLDLGPGQHDLAELLRPRGATVVGVDNDPAVVELGAYKGLEVIAGNLKLLPELGITTRFDGIFCKLSFNAFWFHDDDDAHRTYIDYVASLSAAHGWAWCAPWNGVPDKAALSTTAIERVARVQRSSFLAHGFRAFEMTPAQAKTYGIHGVTCNHALFVRNVMPRAGVELEARS